MHEEWRDVAGYEGLYQVSNFGEVKSMPREISYINRYGYKTTVKTIEKKMTPSNVGRGWMNKCGYLSVMLTINGKQKRVGVHRLVAQAFIPNPDNKPQVNHIDGNKHNNKVDNLEWVTREENMQHAAHKLKCLSSMWSPDPVLCVETGKKYKSISEAARELGLNRRTLTYYINKGKPYCGYHWDLVQRKVGQE